MTDLSDFIVRPDYKPSTEFDMCKCSECKKVLKVSDCHSDYDHHDGWEMPAYNEISCPHCEDGGCVDDFWSSEPF